MEAILVQLKNIECDEEDMEDEGEIRCDER
jgi:hypothetical protein